jgi:AbrB family looped-hinge helix DNA binding protein
MTLGAAGTALLAPTYRGNMAKVDAKGRVVLPQEVRDRLGITPGTEVTIHEKDGKAIVEPEDDPERIIERLHRLAADAAADREPRPTPCEERHPIAQHHAETIREGARDAANGDE